MAEDENRADRGHNDTAGLARKARRETNDRIRPSRQAKEAEMRWTKRAEALKQHGPGTGQNEQQANHGFSTELFL